MLRKRTISKRSLELYLLTFFDFLIEPIEKEFHIEIPQELYNKILEFKTLEDFVELVENLSRKKSKGGEKQCGERKRTIRISKRE